jgi:muconolactone delta-isomerase
MANPRKYGWFHRLPEAGTNRLAQEMEQVMAEERALAEQLRGVRRRLWKMHDRLAAEVVAGGNWTKEEVRYAIDIASQEEKWPDCLHILPSAVNE